VATKLKYFVLLLLFSKFVIAQNAVLGPESFNWFFGENAGITFNTIDGIPVAVKGALITEEGCATVSDAEGNLLFYASGETVWNRLHKVMKGGTGMPGGFSSTQAVLILQQPGVNDIFYVFNTENLGGRLTYSLVDMSGNGGFGEVVSKGVFIADSIGEKMSAVYHSNGRDIWLVVKQKNRHLFKSFLINETGIVFPPVESSINLDFDLSHKYSAMGYLNFASSGDKLAAASYSASQFELYDFDRFTGKVSNPIIIKIPEEYNAYGVCFSPDGSKLYASYYDFDAYLVQYNLKNYDSLSIANSATTIAEYHDGLSVGAIQIGPDRKLYVSRYKNHYLSVINNPDADGISCNFDSNGVFLQGVRTRLGLPNFTYVNHFYSVEPDPAYHNIYFLVGNMHGMPGDTTQKITLFAKTLNDSIEAKNLDITACIEFDASAFILAENPLILSNVIEYGKRRITFRIKNVNISPDLQKILEFPGTVLLSGKKRNEIRITDINLKDTIYKVFSKHGCLMVEDVCQNSLRTITAIPMLLNIKENPVKDDLFFDFSASLPGKYSCEIVSMNGETVFYGNFSIDKENIKFKKNVPVKDIVPGVYILVVRTPGKQLSKMFVKI